MSRMFALAVIPCQSASLLAGLLLAAALPACSAAKDEDQPKPYDAACLYAQDPDHLKCTDFAAAPGATESTYADSCSQQGGTWSKGSLCAVESGTRGCRFAQGGLDTTTWYIGPGYAETEIGCGDQATLVSK